MNTETSIHPIHPILVVDDDEQTLVSISIALRSAGYDNVRVSLDSREASVMIERESFSLLILDLMMPNVSGQEIISRCASHPGRPPVIVVTGSTDTRDHDDTVAAGAVAYLVKPVDRERLITAVKRALVRSSRYDWLSKGFPLPKGIPPAALGLFAAGLVHDLNNILAVVSGYASLISTSEGTTRTVLSFAREIQLAAEKATVMLTQFLSAGKTLREAGDATDLHEALREAEASLRSQLGEGQTLSLSLAATCPMVNLSRGQIDEVVRNLLLNSRDAIQAGGSITLETRSIAQFSDEPDAVLIDVRDTGSGMDAETRSRLFEPFFTTKKKGSGLGMPMVKLITETAGGSIKVESKPGEGTLVRIQLPSSPKKKTAAGLAR